MIKRTSIAWLVAIVLIGIALGWVLVRIVDSTTGRILGVPLIASLGLWALAIGVLLWAVVSRPRLIHPDDRGHSSRGPQPVPVPTGDPQAVRRAHPDRMPPLLAARTAALAMAASRTGALIGGFYLGIIAALIGVISTPSGSDSVTASLIAAGACAVLVGSAIWLESMCRLRGGD